MAAIVQERRVYVLEKEDQLFSEREDEKTEEVANQGLVNGFSTRASQERWFSAIKPVKSARAMKVIEFDYSRKMLHMLHINNCDPLPSV